jgi:predicted N-acyltransferase
LTEEYFRRIGSQMGDRARFFARQHEKIIGFALCMVDGDELYAEYVWFDYAVAFKLHYVVRDIINVGN